MPGVCPAEFTRSPDSSHNYLAPEVLESQTVTGWVWGREAHVGPAGLQDVASGPNALALRVCDLSSRHMFLSVNCFLTKIMFLFNVSSETRLSELSIVSCRQAQTR